jgi:hypothetical protein
MDTEVGSEPSRSHRREGTIVALCLFGLLLIGTALEFSRERLSVAALADPDAPMLLQEGQSLDLGGQVDELISDGVSPTSSIRSVDSSEEATTVQPRFPDHPRSPRFPRRGTAVRLLTPGGPPDAVDVATWTRQTAGHHALVHSKISNGLLEGLHSRVQAAKHAATAPPATTSP